MRTIWLTASGGPFRTLPLEQFEHITVAQALKHPTWVMGQRITIDSATMLNKGLEIIEACRLFHLPPSAVRVTVHPQSTIHSLVEFIDGSILAQLSVTDMRLPILYALTYPERIASDLTFDMNALAELDFSPPDFARFPCLRLAYQAAESGGEHCICDGRGMAVRGSVQHCFNCTRDGEEGNALREEGFDRDLIRCIQCDAVWRSDYRVGGVSCCGRMSVQRGCLRARKHARVVWPIFKV